MGVRLHFCGNGDVSDSNVVRPLPAVDPPVTYLVYLLLGLRGPAAAAAHSSFPWISVIMLKDGVPHSFSESSLPSRVLNTNNGLFLSRIRDR